MLCYPCVLQPRFQRALQTRTKGMQQTLARAEADHGMDTARQPCCDTTSSLQHKMLAQRLPNASLSLQPAVHHGGAAPSGTPHPHDC